MKVLLVSRYKHNFASHILPFVEEQGKALEKAGLEIGYFLIEGDGMAAYWRNVGALKRKINEFRPDVVHAHYGLSGITAVLQKDVPVVTTFHNGEILSKYVNFASSLAARRASFVVCVARHIYDRLVFKPANYGILPCGVDLSAMPEQDFMQARRKLGFKDDVKYVLFGGAFANLRKNYPLLEKAVGLVKGYKIEVLEMNGLDRGQVNDLMYACDVFCLPSKSEGSPQALKEAMACNCPVVATDIADVRHLLGNLDGHYICSFEPENVASMLTKAFAFGRRTEGRKRIMELGLDNADVAKKLVSIYKNVIR